MNDSNVNFSLMDKSPLSLLVYGKGIKDWKGLLEYVQNLPYGRNENREDLSLLLKEGKGTCSSKHAFLKRIADLNKISNVKLVLGIYKMNAKNTPGIGNEIEKSGLKYIPEAHCYLTIEGMRVDVTSASSSFEKVESVLLQEMEIEPEQIVNYKVEIHKEYLSKWILEQKLEMTFDELWFIRENCILNLSNQS